MAVTPSEMPYPQGAQAKLVRFPVVLYRMGLGPILGRRIAILTTRGRRTGLLRYSPIGYMRDGDLFYAVSAWGERSDWYKNLQANPSATLQIGNWRFAVKAEMLETPEEIKAMLEAAKSGGNEEFAQSVEHRSGGNFDMLRAVRLTPTGYPPEGEIPQDLMWVWWALGGLFALSLLRGLIGGKKKPGAEKKADKDKGKDKDKDKGEKPLKPEPVKLKVEKKAKQEAPAKKEDKAGGLKLILKLVRVAPVLLMIYRKISSAQEGEGKGMAPKDWMEVAPMLISALRSFAS
ncbi:MAG: nitroreductase family deazaflavin-dependent oxidoreductase [Anaerolineae bacterium]|nr:nitroreductase family deazaflavin-dependent oxidoreductase [Anaerolineae bacterium]